jgi:hypothetical protein
VCRLFVSARRGTEYAGHCDNADQTGKNKATTTEKKVAFVSLGIVILIVAVILVLFGVGQRVLDRLRLNDKVALILMVAIIGFSFVPDIPLGGGWSVNVGGVLIPFGLVVYLWIKAGSTWEKVRSVIAGIISAGVVLATNMLLPAEPEALSIDPYIIYGALAGLTAYLFGRSRRGAFMAGIMGVLVADITRGIINGIRGIPVTVSLGGAGAADAVVLSGFIALLLAEGVGELLEKIQGGTRHKNMVFDDGEFKPAGQVPGRNRGDRDE